MAEWISSLIFKYTLIFRKRGSSSIPSPFEIYLFKKKHFNDEQLHAPPSAKINADKNDHFNEVYLKNKNAISFFARSLFLVALDNLAIKFIFY